MMTRWEAAHRQLVAAIAPTLRARAIRLRRLRAAEANALVDYARRDTWEARAAWLAARRDRLAAEVTP